MRRSNIIKKQVQNIKGASSSISPEQLKEKITKTAQMLYEKKGRVAGHELNDWLEAEKIVKRELNYRG